MSLTLEQRDIIVRKKSLSVDQPVAANEETILTKSSQEIQSTSKKQHAENRQELLGSHAYEPESQPTGTKLTIEQVLAKYGRNAEHGSLKSQANVTTKVNYNLLKFMTHSQPHVIYQLGFTRKRRKIRSYFYQYIQDGGSC